MLWKTWTGPTIAGRSSWQWVVFMFVGWCWLPTSCANWNWQTISFLSPVPSQSAGSTAQYFLRAAGLCLLWGERRGTHLTCECWQALQRTGVTWRWWSRGDVLLVTLRTAGWSLCSQLEPLHTVFTVSTYLSLPTDQPGDTPSPHHTTPAPSPHDPDNHNISTSPDSRTFQMSNMFNRFVTEASLQIRFSRKSVRLVGRNTELV